MNMYLNIKLICKLNKKKKLYNYMNNYLITNNNYLIMKYIHFRY